MIIDRLGSGERQIEFSIIAVGPSVRVDYYTYSPIADLFEEDANSQEFFDLKHRDNTDAVVVGGPLGRIKARIRMSL